MYESSIAETVHFKGTRMYSAPEMLSNVYNLDIKYSISRSSRKTDMYAFAILMLEVMTECIPFQDITNEVMFCAHVHQGCRPSIASIPPDYPNKLKTLISDTWDADRKQRKTAVEGFQMLKFYYNLMCEVVNEVYLLSRPEDHTVSMHIWHRLTQKGLNVQHCNELTVTDGVVKSRVVLACLTKNFQSDVGCISELKHARELTSSRRIIPVFLQPKSDIWMDGDMYYYCQMRDRATVSRNISNIVSDPSWHSDDDDDHSNTNSLNALNAELDRLIECIHRDDNIRKM